jgi:lipopolysaccharide transport system ATP-binding protein
MVKALNQNEQKQTLTRADDVVLSVNGVSKKFCRDLKRSLLYGVQDITADLVGLRRESDRLRPKEFWALQNVSFQLRRGEALGLVGKNGSGKSTLLRVIAGLIKPDAGSVDVCGRIAPLIALSAGFNPILTGRENIYANMSILGLSQKEIDERFDQVVEFAEIGDAIDAPVQTYSSGMTARLGFACAIHTEPDILLIDEVLAVGDAKFRSKCTRKLAELRAKGTSFIFVSHNSMAIMAVSTSAIYLQKGKLIAGGTPDKIVEMYEEDLFLGNTKVIQGKMTIPEKSPSNSSGVDITSICLKNLESNTIDSLTSGESASFCVGFKAHRSFSAVSLRIEVREVGGENNTILFLSGWLEQGVFDISTGNHEIQIQMPYVCFKPGVYVASVNLRKDSSYIFDTIESFTFVVRGDSKMSRCSFYQPHSWKLVTF